MAIATATLREALAIAYGQNVTYLGLQTTAKTGSTAGTEVTGGSYARKPVTWTAGAVDGSVTATATFDIPAGVTVQSAFGTGALTGGTFLDDYSASYNSQTSAGQLTLTVTYTQS
jgi:hypothetical protein